MSATLIERLRAIVGGAQVVTDPDVLEGRSVDYTGRYRGRASALVRPGSADEVAAVLRECRGAGAFVTVQGGRTSLVAGTVPEHDDVLLSTERLTGIGEIDPVERRVRWAPACRWPSCSARPPRRVCCSGWTWPPGLGDPRRHGVHERRRPAHRALRQHG